MTTPPPHHILIIGAGVGGLTLAQALTKKKIPFSIFERDPDPDSRAQGYALALHTVFDRLTAALPDTLPPLREAVSHLAPLWHLPIQFVMYAAHDPEGRTGVQSGPERRLLRANRRRLREWLRTGIDVQYDKQVVEVIEEGEEGVRVRFKDGSEARGSMVVGADGARSLVRQYLLNGKPDPLQDIPIASIVGEVELTGDGMIHQLELGHSGTVVVQPTENQDDYVMVFTGLNEIRPDAKSALYYWLVYFHNHQGSASHQAYEEACKSRETLLAMAKEKVKHFHPALRRTIERTPVQGMKFPPLVLRDMVLSEGDIPVGRVTLLGDSAHCMAPFRGEGGIRAIEDALELVEYIDRIVQGVDVKEMMIEYRKKVAAQGRFVRESREAFDGMRKMWTSTGAPKMLLGAPTTPIPKKKVVIQTESLLS